LGLQGYLKPGVDIWLERGYNTLSTTQKEHAMTQKTIASSTGGTITFTKTGLIHKSGNAYSGKIAAVEAKQKPAKQ
jgi:hypothetical protein